MLELLKAAGNYFPTKFDGVIRIEMDGAIDSIWVDGRVSPPSVSTKAPANLASAFCLWRGQKEIFARVFALEERRLESAFIAGRVQISGDMSVMARLEPAERGAASGV
ncbi:MAG: hypothetical protein V3V30_01500 [Parvularculaceae bacterium]